MSSLQVRHARPDEITWINERYDEVGFLHSDFSKEFIAIAEIDGVRAGLGRVVRVTHEVGELGGMFVSVEFRRRGIAEAIVRYLLQEAPKYSALYCLPFEHLSDFYQGFGFKPCERSDQVPEELLKKLDWCSASYPARTLLLVLKSLQLSITESTPLPE